MAKKWKLETVGHPSPPRRNTRATSKSDLEGCGAGGSSHNMLVMLPPCGRGSLEQVAEISRECQIKMWKTRGAKKGIIMGDEVKQKSKGKEVMDERHIIKKQPDKDLRKKGSARRLILINNTLEDPQKNAIEHVGFGELLLVQCWSIPEKLSSWLIKRFDITRSELVIPQDPNWSYRTGAE
ncbi:hypothetical protein PVAP13_2KG179500 [Panicum virgatum]|uniref:Uncharacterized protein n=1 Tax=Panicum virgatum TaxID=38727 RepID=A0A8T0W6P0_PANVG|nr:hypothetical protein PVAP13_2KG179500 [Panicum virgatum]